MGFLVHEFECHALFLDEASYKHCVTENSISLIHDFGGSGSKVHRKYCLVVGTYRAVPKSHVQINGCDFLLLKGDGRF